MFIFWSSDPHGGPPRVAVPQLRLSRGHAVLFGGGMLALGLGAYVRPDLVLAVVPRLFGALLALVGVATLFDVAPLRRHLRPVLGRLPARWLARVLAAEGVLALTLGLVFLVFPLVAGLLAAVAIGFWALLSGASAVSLVLRHGARTQGEVLAGALGGITLLAGVFLVASPIRGAFAVASGLGFLAALAGLFTLLAPWQRTHSHAPRWSDRVHHTPRRGDRVEDEPPVPEAWQDPWSVPGARARREAEARRARGSDPHDPRGPRNPREAFLRRFFVRR